ncbi:unnamed protein product [Phytomonas sp. Hart1]|nr:unnamed protein product [Phytomonas sp. Hart1]|eukprot:CCW68745.1 unnamed protein product [Phytomonas sp. isolate Hart1]
MAQKRLSAKSKATKSAGAMRKHVGDAKKKSTFTKAKNSIERKARSNYIHSIEAAMASRVPSDQSSKLKIVKPAPVQRKKNMKKPLTRGRKRK